MRKITNLIPSLLLAALLTVSASSAQAQTAAPAGESTALLASALELKADAERGGAEFKAQSCSRCHRKDASGRPDSDTPRLSGQHASVIVKQVLDIRSGRRNNPPMKPLVSEEKLSLQNLADIAAYLQALPVSGAIAKGPGSGVARGKKLFTKDCAGCHGAAGEGHAVVFAPMVAAQHYTYLLRELEFIRNGERGNSNPAMASLLKTYAQDDLEAVADYMAQLPAPKRK
ncbi:MAG: c-type cytochrome [Gammaproteobacteria bacterium]|uniref:c-type cytochrome n=1 Tax=Rhodoferax sp. TaxID=50421 RepID=UPI0017FA1CE0|nr:c-type cytochrome [Rhodoferax sp.]MBU3900542.1 c-type cytochrome [Gammaproteobacteria bacterium]MBA3057553.1 c-type cytochrome [Rhodoferax sp.]MBU3996447.1 c-type cytochrome [Gammaproteobacteria bacterium]MBU4079987.1 c-type cytochrome [Gammaproteobacteria bacterium]MBU4113443.1 c-type cytochrome [Gammaproteobacteria bacterium]